MSSVPGALGGIGGNYCVSGEMGENDDEIEDSFIIIPRDANEEEEEEQQEQPVTLQPTVVGASGGLETLPMKSLSNRQFDSLTEHLDMDMDHYMSIVPSTDGVAQIQIQDPNSTPNSIPIASKSMSTNQDSFRSVDELVPNPNETDTGAELYSLFRDTGMNRSVTSMVSTATVASNTSSASDVEVRSLEEANEILHELSMENRKLKDVLTDKNEKMKKDLDAYRNLQSTMVKMSSLDLDHKVKCEERIALVEQLKLENKSLKDILEIRCAQFESSERQNEEFLEDLCKRNESAMEEMEQKLKNLSSSSQMELMNMEQKVIHSQQLLETANYERKQLNELLRLTETELAEIKSLNQKSKAEYEQLLKVKDTLHEAFEDSKITIEQLNKIRLEKTRELADYVKIIQVRDGIIGELEAKVDSLHMLCSEFEMNSSRRVSDASDLNGRLNVIAQQLKQELLIRENELANERKALGRANELLAEKDEQMSVLQTKLALYRVQEEELQLYKDQMEEYRANYEAERDDRLQLKEVRDRLGLEVAILKAELAKKSKELERLHKTHITMAQEHLDCLPDKSSMSSTGSVGSSKSIGVLDEMKGAFNYVKQELFGTDSGASGSGTGRKSVGETSEQTASGSAAAASPNQNELVYVSKQGARTRAPRPQPQVDEDDEDKKCPICKKMFATENALISHASHCGDTNNVRRSGFLFP